MKDPFGIGLRSPHIRPLLDTLPEVGWLEVHSENYFHPRRWSCLEAVAEYYPLSFHGIGLSLGSSDPVDLKHLSQLKALVDHFDPIAVSDHLSWSTFQGEYFNDLLPMIYCPSSLDHCCRKLDIIQNTLQRPIAIENPSTYLQSADNTLLETDFWQTLATRTGCTLLLDLNNVFVNCHNHDFDPSAYLKSIDPQSVSEIHLAGGVQNDRLWIDSHSTPVNDTVWQWYAQWVEAHGISPTLIEWDQDLPELSVLINEAKKAKRWAKWMK